MIAPKLYPFHSLLCAYDIWFTQTYSGMQLGQKQGLGIVTCNTYDSVVIGLLCVCFLKPFLQHFVSEWLTAPPSELVPHSHKCLLCSWVPLGGTWEHEALVWVGYKRLWCGSNLPCGVYYSKFLDFFPVWGEHSVNHRWLCTGEDVDQVCGHRSLLHQSTMGLAQEWTPPR